jgi:hypothetical protein
MLKRFIKATFCPLKLVTEALTRGFGSQLVFCVSLVELEKYVIVRGNFFDKNVLNKLINSCLVVSNNVYFHFGCTQKKSAHLLVRRLGTPVTYK